MRTVILGNGQLGNALAQLGLEQTTVLDRARLDLTDLDAIAGAVSVCKPDVVINAAAYNQVDESERRPDLAFLLNAAAPARIAQAATAAGARFVHVSTDHVFDGTAGRPYLEDDLPAPVSIYGASKLAGEHLARANAPGALVVRTSVVFGTPAPGARAPSSFVRAILRQAVRGNAQQPAVLHVVRDQTANPTYAPDLAAAIAALVQSGASGTVHMANTGAVSRYELACAIVAAAGLYATVIPVTSAERNEAARRPTFTALDLGRLQGLGVQMPAWQDALQRHLSTLGYRESSTTPGSTR